MDFPTCTGRYLVVPCLSLRRGKGRLRWCSGFSIRVMFLFSMFSPPLSRLCRQPPQWEPKKPLLEERCLKGGVVALSKRPSYEIIREKWTSSALPLRKKSTLIIECTKKGDHWSPLRKQITYHNAKLPHIKTAL